MTVSALAIAAAPGAEWTRLCDALSAGEGPLPLGVHAGFPSEPGHRALLFGISGSASGPVWGGVAEVGRSRVVPWRAVMRVTRVGPGIRTEALGTVAEGLVALAEARHALRLSVELWEPDATARARIVDTLRAHRFRAVAVPRMYTHTVLIDLTVPEATLLASFHATCRRHIRAIEKHGLRCETVHEVRFADRLARLDAETMARTGGRVQPIDWPAMIRFAAARPALAQLVGVFRSDDSEEDGLLGYVLGLRHHDTVEYFRAASARPGDLRAPLLYRPAWEVMRWAQRGGARWFDFGGLAPDAPDGHGSAGGIADFKRSFRPEITEVGAEMFYAPSMTLDSFARTASDAIATIKARMARR